MNNQDKVALYKIGKTIVFVLIVIFALSMFRLIISTQEQKNIVRVEYVNDPDSTIYKSEIHVKPIRKTVYVYTIYGLLFIDNDNYYYKYNMYEGMKVNSKIEKIIYKDGNFKYKLVEINE